MRKKNQVSFSVLRSFWWDRERPFSHLSLFGSQVNIRGAWHLKNGAHSVGVNFQA